MLSKCYQSALSLGTESGQNWDKIENRKTMKKTKKNIETPHRLGIPILLVLCFTIINIPLSLAQSTSTTTIINLNKKLKAKPIPYVEEYPSCFYQPGNELPYWIFSSNDDQVILACSAMDSLSFIDQHPFINSVRLAYANHRPLVINPDITWLVIAQGFALHVKENADLLRSQLVDFDSTMTLRLLCKPGLLYQPGPQWEPYFSQFSEQIATHTGQDLVNNMTCHFSTTTPTSLVASQITLMAALKSYFNYEIIESCGIPQIILEGTPEDWQKLVEKAHFLRQYGLDWWMDELEPVLQKIAKAAKGEKDLDFWKSLYKKEKLNIDEEGCGLGDPTEKINGWIVKFYPYDDQGKKRNLKELDDNDIRLKPCEMASTPLLYTETNNTQHNLNIYAGLLGIIQDPRTHALKPQLVWIISEPQTKP